CRCAPIRVFDTSHRKQRIDRPAAGIVNEAQSLGGARTHLWLRISQGSTQEVARGDCRLADAAKRVAGPAPHAPTGIVEAVDQGFDACRGAPVQSPGGTLANSLVRVGETVQQNGDRRCGAPAGFDAYLKDLPDGRTTLLQVGRLDVRR